MIAVQIEFLGIPKLSDPSAPRFAEWPPAPDRFFQAMVAAAGETGQDMEVLRHLESVPLVAAGDAVLSPGARHQVPSNFTAKHERTPVDMPHAMVNDRVVTYAWNAPEDIAPKLRPIVEAVTHVGRSSSFVRATLVDQMTPTWIPDERGEVLLRVPHPGRLTELQAAFQAGRRSPPARMVGYRAAGSVYPSAGWHDLMILRPHQALDPRDTVAWTEKMRAAVMSRTREPIPPIIHGHGEHRHVAWTALPNVGNAYARGEILGVGCWLPGDITPVERGVLGASLMRVREIDGVRFDMDKIGLKSLQAETWSRASRTWASVTPVALDRWPRRTLTPEESVMRTVEQAGLPRPAKVILTTNSSWTGSIDSRRWVPRKGKRYITHARLTWDHPVAGPVLIGADRYFGGGLCRPVRERESHAT